MSTQGAGCNISFTVNGETKTVHVHPMERLLDVLRLHLGLTGAKEGCGEGECGSCSVLIDGVLVNSCLVPIVQAQETKITTVEGLADAHHLNRIQQTILECGGAQCGICTPGVLIAASHLLNRNPHPTPDEIKEGLSGNLCRCTGYAQICEAVAQAASEASQ